MHVSTYPMLCSCGSMQDRRLSPRLHTQHLTGPGTLPETSCGNTLLSANMVAHSFPPAGVAARRQATNLQHWMPQERWENHILGRKWAHNRPRSNNVQRRPFYTCAPLSILRRWHHNLSQTIVFIIFARCLYFTGVYVCCVYSRRLSARAKLKMARKKKWVTFLWHLVAVNFSLPQLNGRGPAAGWYNNVYLYRRFALS